MAPGPGLRERVDYIKNLHRVVRQLLIRDRPQPRLVVLKLVTDPFQELEASLIFIQLNLKAFEF